jgi:hypothetical protein
VAKSRKLYKLRQMPITERTQGAFPKNNLPFIIRIGTGILAVMLVSIAVSRLIYPFDIGHLEAFNWMPAAHLLEGKNPYAYAFTPPYSMAPYGVVYYALLAVGINFFGFNLWWGRFLSVLAFAVCIWAVVKITKSLTGDNVAAWIAFLVSLALFPAQAWIAIMRSDFIGLAFAFAAVCLVFTLKRDAPISSMRLIVVILLSVGALFTKQTLLLPVGIIVLRFLQLNRWREAVLFGAGFLILTASGMFFLNYASGGGYVWQHFTHGQKLPFSLEKSLEEVWRVLTEPTTIIFAAVLLIFAYKKREFLYWKDRSDLINKLRSPKLLILFYLFISFAAAAISSGRVGANTNYYLENSFVIAIFCGLIYEDFRQKLSPKIASAIIILFILGGAFQLARVARGEYFRWQALSYYREISDTAAKYAPPGSVCLSVYPELIARNGCPFYFDDYGEYIGDWSPELRAIFEREVKEGRFAVIIWKKDNLQEEFPNYQLVPMSQSLPDRFFPVYLYVRKSERAQ